VEERFCLQDAVPATKNKHSEAKKKFTDEKKNLENGKAFGKPIKTEMDEVLKNNGIDRTTMFGGTIKGNGARKLMENCDAIISKMEEHVLQAPTRFAETDDEICHVGKTH
jgi:hypothetical protein